MKLDIKRLKNLDDYEELDIKTYNAIFIFNSTVTDYIGCINNYSWRMKAAHSVSFYFKKYSLL